MVFASARGPGVFENYSIHQIEMIVVAMCCGARRALAHGTDSAPVVVYEYADGRCSVVNHMPWSGFSLAVQTAAVAGATLNMEGDFWVGFVDALLTFFDTGIPQVTHAETCEAIAMHETGAKALLQLGIWVDIAGNT